MKELLEQNKHDVQEFISESIGQLVDRSVKRTLQEVRMRVIDKWKAMHKVLTTPTARSIYNLTPAKRIERLCEARHRCWIKMGAYNNIADMLYKMEYEEYM